MANIYLNYLDTVWEKRYASLGTLVRYTDDRVILCHTKKDAIQSIQILKAVFQKLELEMNLDKSKLVCNTMGLIDGINRKVIGMRNYYRISRIAMRWLNRIDWYILELLTLHNNKRSNLSIVREMTKYRLKKLSVV